MWMIGCWHVEGGGRDEMCGQGKEDLGGVCER